MKVLIVYFSQHIFNDNLYVKSLFDEMKRQQCQVECDIDRFWDLSIKYDIIHFQFPEVIFKWGKPKLKGLQALRQCIETRKHQGTKFIYTRHDKVPHYCTDPNKLELYQIVENSCDMMIHLGEHSLKEYSSTHNRQGLTHAFVPHHIYDQCEYASPSQQESRKRLGIPNDRFVILTFGSYRDTEERDFVMKAFHLFPHSNKYLLAPGFYNDCFGSRRTPIKNIINYFKQKRQYNLPKAQAQIGHTKLDNNELPFYFSAADIVLVQRKSILNSGNIPMSFLFHKVVAGPSIGNAGELLSLTGNPSFDPNDIGSVVNALSTAHNLANDGHGDTNYLYAKKNLNTNLIARITIELYKSLHQQF